MTKPAEDRVAGEFNPAGRLIESSRWRLAKRDVSGDWGTCGRVRWADLV